MCGILAFGDPARTEALKLLTTLLAHKYPRVCRLPTVALAPFSPCALTRVMHITIIIAIIVIFGMVYR